MPDNQKELTREYLRQLGEQMKANAQDSIRVEIAKADAEALMRDYRGRIGYAEPPTAYPPAPDDDWHAMGAHLEGRGKARGYIALGILVGCAAAIGVWLLAVLLWKGLGVF